MTGVGNAAVDHPLPDRRWSVGVAPIARSEATSYSGGKCRHSIVAVEHDLVGNRVGRRYRSDGSSLDREGTKHLLVTGNPSQPRASSAPYIGW